LIVKIYRISYLSLLFFTFVSMTGSLYGINLKIPLAFISLLTLLFILLRKDTPINRTNFLLFVFFVVLSITSTLIGIFNGFKISFVINEFIGVLSPLIILSLYNSNFISIQSVKKTMLAGAVVYSFSKVVISFLISINIISFVNFYDFVQEVFGYKFVSMLISPEYNIIRIYIVNDLLIALTPLLLFNKDKDSLRLSKPIIFFIYIIFSLSMFLSYSRFLITVFIITSLLPNLTIFKLTAKKVLTSLYGLSLCVIYVLMFGIPKVIQERFSFTNDNNIQSDNIRSIQFDYMIDMISKHKIIGAGLGSYTPNFIRSSNTYVYELQWMSLVFKFGFPIFIFISLIILIYFVNNFIVSFKSVTLFLLILSSGIFNPYLETTIMGACLLILYCNYGKGKLYITNNTNINPQIT
jgi:hypothetical protein